MCELFGASFKVPVEVKTELQEFYSHSIHHPHGWGMLRRMNEQYEVIREPVRAVDSHILGDVIEGTGPQTNILAHIRLATVGTTKAENCHPFTGRDASGRTWTMIHNGTIYSSRTLMKYLDKQEGDTDSERVFLYLLDLLDSEYLKTGSLTKEQRFAVVESLVDELSYRNKLNLMLFDGELLYVHKNMKNTMFLKKSKNGVMLSTTALSQGWQAVGMCRLYAFEAGDLLFESRNITHEFIPTLEYISALAAMNI